MLKRLFKKKPVVVEPVIVPVLEDKVIKMHVGQVKVAVLMKDGSITTKTIQGSASYSSETKSVNSVILSNNVKSLLPYQDMLFANIYEYLDSVPVVTLKEPVKVSILDYQDYMVEVVVPGDYEE